MKESQPRLLLIDDHAELAEATAMLLRRHGFEVQIFESGAGAIEASAAFRPDIVLCDLTLPDMSGFDVALKLRTQPLCENVLFVIHSALRRSDIEKSEDELRAMKIDFFLTKPLSREKIETLRELMRGRHKFIHDR
jgi:two-component system CheB/CheR fusion protein